MKIKLYQINLEKDKKGVAFDSYDQLKKYQGVPDIDSSIYDKVYDGEVDATSLEGVYRIFNIDRPTDFIGRSLSVSDVVEVEESNNVKQGFYFCDSIGFKAIQFNSEKSGELKKKIRILAVEPGKAPYVVEIPTGLESLQHEVDGYIEVVYPFEDPVAIICNEEGKINRMPLNRAMRNEGGEIYDIIAGRFLVVGIREDNFGSLTDDEVKKYSELYATPEIFEKNNGEISVLPVSVA